MGTSLLLAGAAAALGAGNQYFAARKQDKAAAAGIREKSQLQREADERVSRELGTLEESNPEAARTEAMAQYMTQLRRNRQATEGTPDVPGASDRYSTAVDESQDATQAYAGRVANLLSRIDAPATQRRAEGRGFGDLASDIGQIGRRSAGEDFLTRLRVRSIAPNPWIGALADFGSAYARGAAGKPGVKTVGQPDLDDLYAEGTIIDPITRRSGGLLRG